MSSQAIVVAVKGPVFVIDKNGAKRALHTGDVVNVNETIVTENGGTINLQMADGRQMQIGDQQVVRMTQNLADDVPPEAGDSALETASVSAVLKAVAEGKDIGEVLEATAAGGNAPTSSYGNSFVNLLPIVLELTNNAYDYQAAPSASAPIETFTFIGAGTDSAPIATTSLEVSLTGSFDQEGKVVGDDGENVTYTIQVTGSPEALAAVENEYVKVDINGTPYYLQIHDGIASIILTTDETQHGLLVEAVILGVFTDNEGATPANAAIYTIDSTESSYTVVDDTVTLSFSSAEVTDGVADDEAQTTYTVTLTGSDEALAEMNGKYVKVMVSQDGGEATEEFVLIGSTGTGTLSLDTTEAHGASFVLTAATGVYDKVEGAYVLDTAEADDLIIMDGDVATSAEFTVVDDTVTLSFSSAEVTDGVADDEAQTTYTVTLTGSDEALAEMNGKYVKVMVSQDGGEATEEFVLIGSTGTGTLSLDTTEAHGASFVLTAATGVYDKVEGAYVLDTAEADDLIIMDGDVATSAEFTVEDDTPTIAVASSNQSKVYESGLSTGSHPDHESDHTKSAIGTFTISNEFDKINLNGLVNSSVGTTYTIVSASQWSYIDGSITKTINIVGTSFLTTDGTVIISEYNNVTQTFEYTYTLSHATTDVSGENESNSFKVTAYDGSDSNNATITINIEDDSPSISSIESLVVANEAGETSGDIVGLNFGADGEKSFTISSAPTLEGITNTLSSDGKTLTATINGDNNTYNIDDKVFYTVKLNDNGTYTFKLVTAQPTILTPLNFAQVISGGPQETVTLTAGTNSIKFDGLTFNPITYAPINSPSSSIDDINPNNIGFGIGNGNVDDNEGFNVTLTHAVDGLQFTVVAAAGNIASTIVNWIAYDTHGAAVDSGSYQLTGLEINITNTQTISIQSDFEFTVLQVRFDHPDDNDAVRIQDFSLIDKIVPSDLALVFEATATDGDLDTASASFSINIGGMPVAVDDNAYVSEGHLGAINLLLTVDVSGSMGDTISYNNQSMTRLAATKLAINDLLDKYAKNGDTLVRLVEFSGDADGTDAGDALALGTGWVSIATAKLLVDGLQVAPNGLGQYTNYDAALAVAQTAFATVGKYATGQNVSYFFSDGVPTIGSGTSSAGLSNGLGIGTTEETAWKGFLNTNGMISKAIGIGSGVNQPALNPIAWDGKNQTDLNGIVVAVEADLPEALAGTIVVAPITGNVLGNDASGAGGWASTPLVSVTFNSVTYTFTNILDVKTINMDSVGTVIIKGDGSYQFTPIAGNVSDSMIAELSYTVRDINNQEATAILRLGVTDSSEVYAYDNFNQAVIHEVSVPGVVTKTTLADFSLTSNLASSGSNYNAWIFDTTDNSSPTGNETTVIDLASSSIATAVALNANKWIVSSINSTLDASVVSDVLNLVDNDNDSGIGVAQLITPLFSVGASGSSTFSFTVSLSGTNSADTISWTLYKLTSGVWSAQTGAGNTGSIASNGTIVTGILTPGADYRVYISAKDGGGTSSNELTLKLDNFSLSTTSASTTQVQGDPISGNVITNPNNYFASADPWGAIDDKGAEGATLKIMVGSIYTDPTIAGVTVHGLYGDLFIHSDGAYTYTPTTPESSDVGKQDVFSYQLAQADGDADTATLVIQLGSTAYVAPTVQTGTDANDTLTGTSNTDVLVGKGGDDLLSGQAGDDRIEGGTGNDTMSGGAGVDVFKWNLNDQGTTAHPAQDRVTDFNASVDPYDVLDLRDLLSGEHDGSISGTPDNLTNYLHFDKVGSDTVVSISTQGEFTAGLDASKVDQTITLAGVDLLAGSTDQQAIINDLMTNQILKVDH